MVRVILAPRVAAAVLIVLGLGLTWQPAPPPMPEREMKAGYHVLAADLHVHSFPGDGVLLPWDLAREARRRHLDAIALTNHNSTHSWRLAQWLALTGGPDAAMLVPGDEVTAVGFHLAAVGITAPVPWRQPVAALAAAVHAQGGVVIVAHPARKTWRFLDDAALAAVDGVEVDHPMNYVWDEARRELTAFYARANRVHPTIAAIGSTDFHHFAPVGLNRTYLLVTERSVPGIVAAIRAGRTVGCDADGAAHGQDNLVELLGDVCHAEATAPPAGETRAGRIGTWLVWLGVVALVVCGPAQRLA
jgi:predicted metal-dependent phosphoesterase TrpH